MFGSLPNLNKGQVPGFETVNGNQFLTDVIVALRWVQKNIRSFITKRLL
jgi:carboxylesterase type B